MTLCDAWPFYCITINTDHKLTFTAWIKCYLFVGLVALTVQQDAMTPARWLVLYKYIFMQLLNVAIEHKIHLWILGIDTRVI